MAPHLGYWTPHPKEGFILEFFLMERPKMCLSNIDGVKALSSLLRLNK